MVKHCCVWNCVANSRKYGHKKFYILPKDEKRRKKWLSFIGRAMINDRGEVDHSKQWNPEKRHYYVCSAHFVTGQKTNDCTHPDYVPSVQLSPKNETNKFRGKQRTGESSTPKATSAERQSRVVRRQFTRETSSRQRIERRTKKGQDVKKKELSNSNELPEVQGYSKPVDTTERENLYTEMDNLRKERDEALQEVQRLQGLLDNCCLSVHAITNNDTKCMLLTGLNWEAFDSLREIISLSFKGTNRVTRLSLPLEEQLLVTLVKLRQNVSMEFLAHIKGIPKTTCLNYFWKIIEFLYEEIVFLISMSERDYIFKIIPPVFKKHFPRLTCIIDCFEVFTEAPKRLKARSQMYSTYKHHTTLKVFVSCTPLGAINFISCCWGGKASDVQMVRESGFISLLHHFPNDQILSDRGFTLKEDFLNECGVELFTPAFTKGKKQLSAAEVETSRTISSVRIHIERVIGHLRNKYTILKGPLPIRYVQNIRDEAMNAPLASGDKIVKVCAALTNLNESIVSNDN